MARALKILLYVYGVVFVIDGLFFLFFQNQTAGFLKMDSFSDNTAFFVMQLGAAYLAIGVWLIIAGRNPLKHLHWIKFIFTLLPIGILAIIYAYIKGYIGLGVLGPMTALDVVIVICLAIFYPRKAVKNKDKELSQ
jgi:hypothetical protein